MKTAKEMFAELDFKIIKSGDWCILYGLCGFSDVTYAFWLDTKRVSIKDESPLSLEKMIAVYQQMKELGWIE